MMGSLIFTHEAIRNHSNPWFMAFLFALWGLVLFARIAELWTKRK